MILIFSFRIENSHHNINIIFMQHALCNILSCEKCGKCVSVRAFFIWRGSRNATYSGGGSTLSAVQIEKCGSVLWEACVSTRILAYKLTLFIIKLKSNSIYPLTTQSCKDYNEPHLILVPCCPAQDASPCDCYLSTQDGVGTIHCTRIYNPVNRQFGTIDCYPHY